MLLLCLFLIAVSPPCRASSASGSNSNGSSSATSALRPKYIISDIDTRIPALDKLDFDISSVDIALSLMHLKTGHRRVIRFPRRQNRDLHVQHIWTFVAANASDRIRLAFPAIGVDPPTNLALYEGKKPALASRRIAQALIQPNKNLYSVGRAFTVRLTQVGTKELPFFNVIAVAVQRGITCSSPNETVEIALDDTHPRVMLESPNFGAAGSYFPRMDCLWRVSVPEGKRVDLHFETAIDTAVGDDHIIVHDGDQINEDSVTVAQISGHIETPIRFQSTGNVMTIELAAASFFGQGSGFCAVVSLIDK